MAFGNNNPQNQNPFMIVGFALFNPNQAQIQPAPVGGPGAPALVPFMDILIRHRAEELPALRADRAG